MSSTSPFRLKSGLSAVTLSALFSACVSPPVEAPTTTVEQQTNISTAQTVRNKVDLLFMVDNSPSMGAMQTELLAKFPQFLNVFNTLAHPTGSALPNYADLHIGVVTSDYGAGSSPGGGCDASPGGQKGLLQAVGQYADASCVAPTGSVPFIEYAFGANGDTCNLPGGTCTPTALGAQFTCSASVGAMGCGFEHQLESVYAALTNTNENKGFLRDDAILAVVFVTNEDDSSSPPSVDFFSDDMSKVGQYGAYTTYRQTHFGIACGSPEKLTPEGSSNGPLMMCESAPDVSGNQIGGEFDISRYTSFFTTPNKLKADPTNDIILVGIDAPTSPFETILATTKTGNGQSPNPAYLPCSTLGTDCIVALQHSCQNTASPAFFGDPPLRLDAVISNQHLHQTSNICGDNLNATPDYTAALQTVANLIVSALQPSCLTAPIKTITLADGSTQPDCTVSDVLNSVPTSIPYCGTHPTALPCWEENDNPMCPYLCNPSTTKYERPGIVINRQSGTTPPLGTTASIACNTIALANENPNAACPGTAP